jgi:hypothetical protein
METQHIVILAVGVIAAIALSVVMRMIDKKLNGGQQEQNEQIIPKDDEQPSNSRNKKK